MSIVWMDGFDQYGTDASLLTDGLYAEANAVELSTSISRNGGCSLHLRPGAGNTHYVRKVLPVGNTKVGVGLAVYFPSLPAVEGSYPVIFRDNLNADMLSISVMTTGALKLMQGDGTILAQSDPIITAEAWHHIEIWYDSAAGGVAVRVNAVPVDSLALTGTAPTGVIAQIVPLASIFAQDSRQFYIDDFFIATGDGTINNSFIGDRKVIILLPDGNGASQDWVPSSGVAWERLDNIPANDYVDYIQADAVGDASSFTFEDLPPDVTSITAVMALTRQYKIDTGDGATQISAQRAASESSAPRRSITSYPTYWAEIFETDPSTSNPWTPVGVDQIGLKITRTDLPGA